MSRNTETGMEATAGDGEALDQQQPAVEQPSRELEHHGDQEQHEGRHEDALGDARDESLAGSLLHLFLTSCSDAFARAPLSSMRAMTTGPASQRCAKAAPEAATLTINSAVGQEPAPALDEAPSG